MKEKIKYWYYANFLGLVYKVNWKTQKIFVQDEYDKFIPAIYYKDFKLFVDECDYGILVPLICKENEI